MDMFSRKLRAWTNLILLKIVKSISSDVFFDTRYLENRYNKRMIQELNMQMMELNSLEELITIYKKDYTVSLIFIFLIKS